MDLQKAEEMMKLMRNYGVTEMKISDGDSSIKISTGSSGTQAYAYPAMPQPMSPVAAYQQDPGNSTSNTPTELKQDKPLTKRTGLEIRSPFVGTFYAAPAPGEEDFVSVGSKVKKGDTLCIVEAMKLMNEIEAEKDGTITEILIDNEAPVEFDQVLFVID